MKFNIININKPLSFSSSKVDKRMGIAKYGDDNLYPDFLLNLYNSKGSSLHKGIINKKIKMIINNGFEITDSGSFNTSDFNKLFKKVTTDYEIFNGFAFEVIRTRDGKVFELNHIPFGSVRINYDADVDADYAFKLDWSDRKEEKVYFNDFKNKKSNKDLNTIYYYKEYNPDVKNEYPTVQYSTTTLWIELDYMLAEFHFNSVKNGFLPSTIISMNNGIPTEEEQEMFEMAMKKNFQGSENAGKIIITYSDGGDNSPEIIPFEPNSTDERFIQLQEQIEKNIIIGHEVPPNLILTTAGKLGGSEERTLILDEFKETYIDPRRLELLNSFEEVLGYVPTEKVNSVITEK